MIGGGGLPFVPSNVPSEYFGRRNQYYSGETARFVQKMGKYASDFFAARCQGLDPDNLYRWLTARLRMSDLIRPTSTGTRKLEGYKIVLFESERVGYIAPGAKIHTAGNTWLVTDPDNSSDIGGSAVVQRCDVTWNHLDFYGNVLSEPMVLDKEYLSANDPDFQELGLIDKGYVRVRCQWNEHTAQIMDNTRMILGNFAYSVTGYFPVWREFTYDKRALRLLEFTVRREEPNETIDDMERLVAGGKTFSWEIRLAGPSVLNGGETAQLTPVSIRNGEAVIGTARHPISYRWESSNPDVASVDATGAVTGVSVGGAVITCLLEQNPAQRREIAVSVVEAPSGEVRFLSTVPNRLNAYQSVTVSAAYFEDGEQTEDEVEWRIGGAEVNAYTTEPDGNAVTVRCWSGSVEPLRITAVCNGYQTTALLWLAGLGGGSAETATVQNPMRSIRKIEDYLWEAWYDTLDYPNAYRHFAGQTNRSVGGFGCTAVRNGPYYGRNFDWFYNAQAEFVVHVSAARGRYASVGVAGGQSELTEEFVESGGYSAQYAVLPFQMYDGINEKGLVANINVVPLDRGETVSRPTGENLATVSASMLIRYLLDHFATAREATDFIREHMTVYFSDATHRLGYETHFMVADEEETFLVEFLNGGAVVTDMTQGANSPLAGRPYMTNFYLTGVSLNDDGTVYTPETSDETHNAVLTNHITERGSGLERYNLIAEEYETTGTAAGMRSLLDALRYTRTYRTAPEPADPFWYTEYVGLSGLTVESAPEDFAETVEQAGELFAGRTRYDGNVTWQSVHSAVYDLRNKRLSLTAQENEEEFSFQCEGSVSNV